MFNLDQAIAKWRRQMAADGVDTPEVLNELENHLREDIDAQVRAGVDGRQAFETAVERMGRGGLLRNEFAKAGALRMRAWQSASLKIILLTCISLAVFLGVSGLKTGMPLGAKLIGAATVVLLFLFARRYAMRRFGVSRGIYPLTQDTAHTLDVARQEAARYRHDFVGTEHLLLGLLEKGIVPEVLRRLGVATEAIRREVEDLIGPGPEPKTASNPPYTPRAKRALRLAFDEAKAMQQSHVRPESLFLGLLLEDAGVAALALKNLGVDPQRAREEILKARRNNG